MLHGLVSLKSTKRFVPQKLPTPRSYCGSTIVKLSKSARTYVGATGKLVDLAREKLQTDLLRTPTEIDQTNTEEGNGKTVQYMVERSEYLSLI
jgi:hypothetical protein